MSQKLLYRQAIPLNSLLNYSLLQVSIALGVRTRPLLWSKRQILNGVLYQLKNGCNWGDLPRDLPPYSTVYWHYKQWRSTGVLETMMTELHAQVRQQAKKTEMDNLDDRRLPGS